MLRSIIVAVNSPAKAEFNGRSTLHEPTYKGFFIFAFGSAGV